jgi:hypothetical protein
MYLFILSTCIWMSMHAFIYTCPGRTEDGEDTACVGLSAEFGTPSMLRSRGWVEIGACICDGGIPAA